MRRTVLIYVVALLSGVILYSCKPSDEKLQKAVETALTTSENSAITAAVKDGVATITGTVESEEAKTAAETVVKAVKDIKSVDNKIQVVVPVKINPDETLTTTINEALTAGGFTGVKVAVANGEVTLTGDVKKADLQKVMEIANEANPAKVINQLTIKK